MTVNDMREDQVKIRRRPLPPARIARLEAERISRRIEVKRKRARWTHYLYFLICEGHVKIGYARDPGVRCRAAQVGNPFRVILAGIALGGEREERILHRAFRSLHVRAEWFRLAPPLDDVVAKIREINAPDEAREWLDGWLYRTKTGT